MGKHRQEAGNAVLSRLLSISLAFLRRWSAGTRTFDGPLLAWRRVHQPVVEVGIKRVDTAGRGEMVWIVGSAAKVTGMERCIGSYPISERASFADTLVKRAAAAAAWRRAS